MTEVTYSEEEVRTFKEKLSKQMIAMEDKLNATLNQLQQELMEALEKLSKKFDNNISVSRVAGSAYFPTVPVEKIENEDAIKNADINVEKKDTQPVENESENQRNVFQKNETEGVLVVDLLPKSVEETIEPREHINTSNLPISVVAIKDPAVAINGVVVQDECLRYALSYPCFSAFLEKIPVVDLGGYVIIDDIVGRVHKLGLHNCLVRYDYMYMNGALKVFDEMFQPMMVKVGLVNVWGFHSVLTIDLLALNFEHYVFDPGIGLVQILNKHKRIWATVLASEPFHTSMVDGEGVLALEIFILSAGSKVQVASAKIFDEYHQNECHQNDYIYACGKWCDRCQIISEFTRRWEHPFAKRHELVQKSRNLIAEVWKEQSLTLDRVKHKWQAATKVLVKWKNQPVEDASWIPVISYMIYSSDFLLFRLEDKPFFEGEGLMQDIHQAQLNI